MLRRYELTEREWEQVFSLLPPEITNKLGRLQKDNRLMRNAMIWIARSDASWSNLLEHFGSWKSVYSCFRKWADNGVLKSTFEKRCSDTEIGELPIDAFIVQAH